MPTRQTSTSRPLRVAAAQMGPNQEHASRAAVVDRMIALAQQAADARVDLVVFPELALTSYFPKDIRDDVDRLFDDAMPNPTVAPLFDCTRAAGLTFCFGYAEQTPAGRRFNTMAYVDRSGTMARRYRKLHLPGQAAPAPRGQVRVYEPHFFDFGDTGLHPFRTEHATLGMSLCQDRRYPETYRVLGLQGAEVIVNG